MPVQGLDVAPRLTAHVPGTLTIRGKEGQSATDAPRRRLATAAIMQVADEGLALFALEIVCQALPSSSIGEPRDRDHGARTAVPQ
jgi:hypothetical protein